MSEQPSVKRIRELPIEEREPPDNLIWIKTNRPLKLSEIDEAVHGRKIQLRTALVIVSVFIIVSVFLFSSIIASNRVSKILCESIEKSKIEDHVLKVPLNIKSTILPTKTNVTVFIYKVNYPSAEKTLCDKKVLSVNRSLSLKYLDPGLYLIEVKGTVKTVLFKHKYSKTLTYYRPAFLYIKLNIPKTYKKKVEIQIDEKVYGVTKIRRLELVPKTHRVTVPKEIKVNNNTKLVFLEWSDGTKNNTKIIDLSKDRSIEAKYIEYFRITFKSNYINLIKLNGSPVGESVWFKRGTKLNISLVIPEYLELASAKCNGRKLNLSKLILVNNPLTVSVYFKKKTFFLEIVAQALNYSVKPVGFAQIKVSINGTEHLINGSKVLKLEWGTYNITILEKEHITEDNNTKYVFLKWHDNTVSLSKTVFLNKNTTVKILLQKYYKVKVVSNTSLSGILVDRKNIVDANSSIELWKIDGEPLLLSINNYTSLENMTVYWLINGSKEEAEVGKELKIVVQGPMEIKLLIEEEKKEEG